MRKRDVDMFNLSFLDILSGALGAVLFLFIVVPKGGTSPELNPPLQIAIDTVQGKFFGELPDSLWSSQPGDSILSIVFDYRRMPQFKDCPPQKRCPKCPETKARKQVKKVKQLAKASKSTKTLSSAKTSQRVQSRYKGDLPSVPCKFSVEVKWEDITDNVDLFLCKDGSCVYGARKKNSKIGFWDSGKSRTSFFGGDLRTTQEAVRQFDQIIPGSYNVYVQFKASEKGNSSVRVDGLVYSKSDKEQGETFIIDLPFNKSERTKIGTIQIDETGSFTFSKTI